MTQSGSITQNLAKKIAVADLAIKLSPAPRRRRLRKVDPDSDDENVYLLIYLGLSSCLLMTAFLMIAVLHVFVLFVFLLGRLVRAGL